MPKTKTGRAPRAITAALFALLALVLAGASESYSELAAAPGTYRGGALDGGDSLDWSSPLDTSGTDASVFPTRGNPSIAVAPSLSVSGATAAVYCGLYHRSVTSGDVVTWTFLGVAGVSTATGGAGTRSGGSYVANELMYFDTGGANYAELRATDPSNSATVTLVPWTFGSVSRGAQ